MPYKDDVTRRKARLLCYTCNVGLGLFRDKPEMLIKAISYIKKSNPWA